MFTRSERRFERYEYADPENHPLALIRPFIAALLENHTEVKAMPNPAQLKLSPALSYYPTTCTVYVDGDQAKMRGIDVPRVLQLLEERGELNPP